MHKNKSREICANWHCANEKCRKHRKTIKNREPHHYSMYTACIWWDVPVMNVGKIATDDGVKIKCGGRRVKVVRNEDHSL